MIRTIAAASLALAMHAGIAYAANLCEARSGPRLVPLVELYTSEGCDSCPAADRWLSTAFPPAADPPIATVLAFHVDYWDRLGWKDRFAQPAFTARQRDAMRANGSTFVYTPQVLLQGRDVPPGRRGRMAADIDRVRALRAGADIVLAASAGAQGTRVRARAALVAPASGAGAKLWLAYVDSGHATEVKAGENRGARLVHDHVVRALHGPFVVDAAGVAMADVEIPAPVEAGASPSLVAFVQETRLGAVLQTLALPLARHACAR